MDGPNPLWEKLRKLNSKLREIQDPLICGAIEREIDATVAELTAAGEDVPQWVLAEPALLSRFAGAAVPTETPAELPPEPAPPDEPVNGELPESVSPEAVEEAEKLLRQARVHLMRGERDQAASLLAQAERLAPHASAVLEAIGDELVASRQSGKAKEFYKRAVQADRTNVSADKKLADLVFSTDVATLNFSNLHENEVVASARSATVLNFVLPGVGQIVLGDTVKGIFFLVGVIGCWAGAAALGLFQFLVHLMGNSPEAAAHPAAFVLAPLALVLHIAAIADTKGKARVMELRRQVQRPVPPANLPFE